MITKHIKALFCLMMVVSCFAQAAECPIDLRARVSSYMFSSKVARDRYSRANPMYELEIDYYNNPCLHSWTSVGYLYSSKGSHDKTSIRWIPVNVGYKYYQHLTSTVKAYVGAAASVNWVTLETPHDSSDSHKHRSEKRWGYLVTVGTTVSITRNLLVDISSSYNSVKVKDRTVSSSHLKKLDLSGYKLSIALGYYF